MQKRNQKKKSNQQKRKNPPGVEPPGKFKTLALVMPPRMNIKLKFWAYTSLNLSVNPQANYRWRPSAAFDVDPALGGTAMPGFAEMAAFYSTYRVISSKIRVTATNPSTTVAPTIIVVPLNADPTNGMSAANVIGCTGNPYSKMKTIGLLGSPPVVISSVMSTAKIYGDPAIYYDHNFSSLATTIPTNNWFWNVCAYAPAVIAALIDVSAEIECDVEFFDRIFLAT